MKHRTRSRLEAEALGGSPPAPPRSPISSLRRRLLWVTLAAAAAGCVLIVMLAHIRQAQDMSRIVRQAAMEEGLDPDLAEAVVHAESGGNPRARSPANAMGLMQLLPRTAAELAQRPVTEEELYNPRFNVRLGCRYLGRLLRFYNHDVVLALMAYNAGMGRVGEWLRIEDDSRRILKRYAFAETRRYVTEVLRRVREAKRRG